MSAAELREAARLMRERAERASDGPYIAAEQTHDQWYGLQTPFAAIGNVFDCRDAAHIASWHPAVALAVAGAIDAFLGIHWPKPHAVHTESHYNAEPEHDYFDVPCDETCFRDAYICNGCGTRECKEIGYWLPIARAYLGGDQ